MSHSRASPWWRALACSLLAAYSLAAPLQPAVAQEPGVVPPSSESQPTLPRTTLEADQRDDGSTSVAPWLIGSGVAAAAAVAVGGALLQRTHPPRNL